MPGHQVRVFEVSRLISDESILAFAQHCDVHDRGVGWEGFESAQYWLRPSLKPAHHEFRAVWFFAPWSQSPKETYLKDLVKSWNEDFQMCPVPGTEGTPKDEPAEWRILHSYYSGGRQDVRSPLMDEVVGSSFVHEPEALATLRKRNLEGGLPPISVSAQDGSIIKNLLKIAGAKKGVEIGTLGGYSAAWIAEAIGPEGMLVTIEKDAKRSRLAAENLARAGYADRVECRSGDAMQVLENLKSQSPWDFVFIDADKSSYGKYVLWAMENLKPGGLVIADNAYLWGGMLSFPRPWSSPGNGELEQSLMVGGHKHEGLHAYDAAEYQGMCEAWELLSRSPDFETWMLPVPDGILVGQKRAAVRP